MAPTGRPEGRSKNMKGLVLSAKEWELSLFIKSCCRIVNIGLTDQLSCSEEPLRGQIWLCFGGCFEKNRLLMKAHGGGGSWKEPATNQMEEALLQGGAGVHTFYLSG